MAAFIKFRGTKFNASAFIALLDPKYEVEAPITDGKKSVDASLLIWISEADDFSLQKNDCMRFFIENEVILKAAHALHFADSCHVELSLYYDTALVASPYIFIDTDLIAFISAIPATLGIRVFPCSEDEDGA